MSAIKIQNPPPPAELKPMYDRLVQLRQAIPFRWYQVTLADGRLFTVTDPLRLAFTGTRVLVMSKVGSEYFSLSDIVAVAEVERKHLSIPGSEV
jgi:hypothetical protein